MQELKIVQERDRESTENRLLETIGKMIAEEGFEKIGVNAVANKAGVSKILIYRYFGSIEGLIATYIKQYDFIINFPIELSSREQIPFFLKNMFKEQIELLRRNPALRMLHRWELTCNNDLIVKLREQREKRGIFLIEKISELTGYSRTEIAVIATLLNSSITYLVMLEDSFPVYNGITINNESGWNQIIDGIGMLIDKYF